MQSPSHLSVLPILLATSLLAGCSGSSSGSDGPPTVTLSVTDAPSDDLSAFVIGLESVELIPAFGAPVSLLAQPVAVDFAALGELSRVLNVSEVPQDTYTGIQVGLLFDNDRVVINGLTTPAALLDSDGAALTGSLTLALDFPTAILATTGNVELEIDLDLDQSCDVDSGGNQVFLEPTLVPRINPSTPKEHAIGGGLRTVVLASNLFRVGLDAPLGSPVPVITVLTNSSTVFQVDGVCLVGVAGLSALDALAPSSWVQAFGSVGASSNRFVATTVEAGTGSYNGGSDIVEGVVTGRSGNTLTVRGHSNDASHTSFQFNLNYSVDTVLAQTKVVRRGSATQYDADDVNVGQRVRMFGGLTLGPPVLDVTSPTDVVRMELTHVYGIANGAPAGGLLSVDVARIDLRDVGIFSWAQSGATPPDPDAMILSVGNLGTGQGITAGTPIEAVGFFAPIDDTGPDFVASSLVNRAQLALLLVRDRANGLVVTPTVASDHVDLAFSGGTAGTETAVIDQSFQGQTDLVPTGVTIEPKLSGLGIYTIRDRTLQTISLYFTFDAFSQGLTQAFLGGATLYNVGAVGTYDSGSDTLTSALIGVVVQ